MPETITNWLDSNWLALLVGIYLIGMMLNGHAKGFIRLSVSAAAVLLTLVLVRAASPCVTSFLRSNTKINDRIESYIESQTGLDSLTDEQTGTREAQERIIAGLPLSSDIQKLLTEENTDEIWKKLGVKRFQEYIAGFLSNLLITQLSFVILFILIWLGLRVLMNVLDIVAKLPILHGLNQIAGAVLGLMEGLVFVWVAFLVISAFAGTGPGGRLQELIQNSVWMNALYRLNPVSGFLNSIAKAML